MISGSSSSAQAQVNKFPFERCQCVRTREGGSDIWIQIPMCTYEIRACTKLNHMILNVSDICPSLFVCLFVCLVSSRLCPSPPSLGRLSIRSFLKNVYSGLHRNRTHKREEEYEQKQQCVYSSIHVSHTIQCSYFIIGTNLFRCRWTGI